jgi:hypothetical protein
VAEFFQKLTSAVESGVERERFVLRLERAAHGVSRPS